MANILNQVRLSTLENVTLYTNLALGTSLIDGVLVASGDRILVKAQTDKTQNGIYTISSVGAWVRASDFLVNSTQTGGTIVFVQDGASLADTGWIISSNGSLTVGADLIEFEKFSVNLKIIGADIPSSIVLRGEKGYPLTIAELDNNFKYLSVSLTEKLNIEDYTPTSIANRLNTLTAVTGDLNAWKLDGHLPDSSATPDTIALRNLLGELTATNFNGNLVGNANTATLATRATVANNVDGIVAISNGGTGAATASSARNNLGVVTRAGDTMTGKLAFVASDSTTASLCITPGTSTPASLANGDIWSDNNKLYYRLNDVTHTIAPLNSPIFVGAPTAPTMDNISNSTSIATTAFVKNIRVLIDDDLALKAPLVSPSLTGTPLSITPATSDDSTKIATTAFTNSKISQVIADYTTTVGMNSAISTALTNYYTIAGTNTAISTALTDYYTKSNIDTTLTGYYTRAQADDTIYNAVAPKATYTYVDSIRNIINADLALKAPLASPSLTGTPLSVTPSTSDNSTKIATTAFTNSKINDVISSYTTTVGMNSAISTALSQYWTAQVTANAITSSLNNYYTKTNIDTTLLSYYTRTQADAATANAVSVKASTEYVDGLQNKWGTSRKYVQSTQPSTPVDGDIWFKI